MQLVVGASRICGVLLRLSQKLSLQRASRCVLKTLSVRSSRTSVQRWSASSAASTSLLSSTTTEPRSITLISSTVRAETCCFHIFSALCYRSTNEANSAFHPFGVDKWVLSCNNSMSAASVRGSAIWWSLTKERQVWCCLQVKLCDPCLSALRVCMRTKMALSKYTSFPFLSFYAEYPTPADK